MSSAAIQNQETKHVKTKEFVLYLLGIFFYTCMTGMIGSYRNSYLVDVLKITDDEASLFNGLVKVIPFILSFFITMYIDGRKTGRLGKFRPLAMFVVIPMSAILVLSFWTPKVLSGTLLMIYLVTIAVLWGALCTLGNSINMIANVMTSNMKERDNVISFRSISSAVGNSAPLVIVLVIGLIWKDNTALQYIIGAGLCSVVGVITVLLGMRVVRERVTYTTEKKNPFVGIKDVLTNKYALLIICSEFLKSFRELANFMNVFVATAFLGSASKYVIFALPTGIGTAVGMLVINFLLKKFNSKVLYIASGIYSVIANILAFIVGYFYLTTGSPVLNIVFIIFLFLIGLQFGASNLLPSMFQADVLEDIEAKTGKRIDATLPFVISIGTLISGTIATTIAPKILYGPTSIIQYQQGSETQELETKILLLFFYTIVHGIMMFLAGVPFFFYKLTGETKENIHNEVLKMREQIEK